MSPRPTRLKPVRHCIYSIAKNFLRVVIKRKKLRRGNVCRAARAVGRKLENKFFRIEIRQSTVDARLTDVVLKRLVVVVGAAAGTVAGATAPV